MPQIEVMLEMPQQIVAGLASGQLERVGGVVRDVVSKQVVAWLREGGKIAENTNLAVGILNTVIHASTGGLASAGVSALNVAVSARSHFLIMQELRALTNLVSIVGGIGVLNLAATAISTAILLKRLSDLERAIEGLYEHISQEFSQDRKVKLETAIQAATDALNMDNPHNRRLQADSAVRMLFEARQHVWRDVETLKGSPRNAVKNQLLQNNIFQSMQLDSLRSRCLLEIDELCRAKAYLADKLDAYRETSRLLIHRHLGEHRGVFFHKSVSESDLFRYLAIEFWLRADGDRLLEILLSNRHDFWNKEIADESRIAKPEKTGLFSLSILGKEKSQDRPHIDALSQCELLIENLERYEGLHAELEAIERLGITHSEWQEQQEEAMEKTDKDLADHDDYFLLVDKEQLERLSAA